MSRAAKNRGTPVEARPRYIVAEIKNSGMEFGWTRAVYADLSEARAELADAHEAGLTGERIFELRPTDPLALGTSSDESASTEASSVVPFAHRGARR